MIRIRALAMTMALLLSGTLSAFAVQPDEVLADPALESRARALSRELRCMVCQNQSIDDSDAPLARDLRILVRERLSAGDSDQAVLSFLTARYGDFVLLRPPLNWRTALLWLAPLTILAFGVAGLIALLRRRQGGGTSEQAEPALSAAERERIAEITAQRDI